MKNHNEKKIKIRASIKKKEEEQIANHIEAFLKAGGEISHIPSGTSGQPSMACRRLMTISEKAPDKEEIKKQIKSA